MADVFARGAHAFPACFRAALNQAARRGAVLHARQPFDAVDFITPHAAEHLANTRNRVPPVEGMGIVMRGGFQAIAFEVLESRIVLGDQAQVDRHRVLHSRRLKALGHPVAGGFGGHLRPALGPVVWALGRLHVRYKLRACAHQRRTTPPEVRGGAHLGGVDIGVREHPAAPQGSNVVRIDLIMCGLAALDGVHGEGVTQDHGHPLFRTQGSPPGPGDETLDRHHEALTRGRHGLEEGVRCGLHVAVHQDCPVTVHETDVQAPGMPVNTAGQLVWVGGEAPEVSSS
jgi:hypothetical protein